jgi:hypothetical protein
LAPLALRKKNKPNEPPEDATVIENDEKEFPVNDDLIEPIAPISENQCAKVHAN